MKKTLLSPPAKFAISSTGVKFFMVAVLMVIQCTIVTAQKKITKTAPTAANDADNQALFINQNGNVGIGTTDPHHKLQLNGDLHMDGNTIYFHGGWWDKSAFINWNLKDDFNKVDDDKLALAGYGGVKLGDVSRDRIFFPIIRAGFSTKRAVVDIMTAQRTDSANHPNGQLSMYVTGDMNGRGHGVEFRTNDASEGIGFSKNLIYQTGSDRNLNFEATGAGNLTYHTGGNERMFVRYDGLVKVINDFEVGGVARLGNLNIGGQITLGDPLRNITAVNNDGGTYLEFKNTSLNNANRGFRFTENEGSFAIMRIKNSFVGIGTDNPRFPLEINGVRNGDNIQYTGREFTLRGSNGIEGDRGFKSCSVFASGDFVTNNAFIGSSNKEFSDMRLKKDIHKSASQKDLVTLRLVQIVDYKMIDTVADNKQYKKVIAQQVQKVYPKAVGRSFRTLPDVFQKAISVSHQHDSLYLVAVANPQHLKTGDKIELKLSEAADATVVVTKINSDRSFTVASNTALHLQKAVFVYGTVSADVLTVDYDAISMLNVSATQQLAKTIDEQQKEIALLKKQNEAMATENEKLKNEHTATKTAVAAIMARLIKLENTKTNTSLIASAQK